jgi:hypothetical protein
LLNQRAITGVVTHAILPVGSETMDIKRIVNATKNAQQAMKPAPLTYEDMLLAQLQCINAKLTWFVVLSVISIIVAIVR